MRHSLHLFIGKEMVSIAEAISSHLQRHSAATAKDHAHVACWEKVGEIRTVRIIGDDGFKVSMRDDEEGGFYLANLHDRVINIALQDISFGDELYVCVYVQLYDNAIMEELQKFILWSKNSQKSFKIDVYGLADDVAKVFCSSTAEEHELIRKSEKFRRTCKGNCNEIIALKDSNDLNRFLVLQNCNLTGIGLAMDKNTLIRILGEFALLTTEQFNDIFPLADFTRPDVTAFGIAALWFDKNIFTDYLLSRTCLYIMDRENVNQHKIGNPLELLSRARKYINGNSSLLSRFYDEYTKTPSIASSSEKEVYDELERKLDELRNAFVSVLSDNNLSLPEKRAMLALFIGEDDELFDDNVLLEELPTFDDCFAESLNLYIHEENLYETEHDDQIISGPRDIDGKIYLPLDALKKSKAKVRKSQSFIHKCEKKLKDIKEVQQITEDNKRHLTPDGFNYGETTYYLQHDIVERPLAKTYIPTLLDVPKRIVDLRSFFSPIRNQGRIGSCSAFSMTSIFEFALNQAEKEEKHLLSPKFLYYNVCKKNIDGTPIDQGSSLFDNIESLGHDGVCMESLCPYNDEIISPPTDNARINALSHLVTEAKNVNICHKDFTSALADGFPIAISLKLFNSFGSERNGFVFRPTEEELKSSDFGWHAMVICGYSEDKKIYIVRNSWGTEFGDNGYCYIPFSYIEDTNLCQQACIITGISCKDLSSPIAIDEVSNLKVSCSDTEFAITRILKEEEEIALVNLKKEYNELRNKYIQLIGELTNSGKRDKLINHAINRTEANTPFLESKESDISVKVASKLRFSYKWIYFVILLGISVLLYTYSPILSIVFIIVSVFIISWMSKAIKEEEETVKGNPSDVSSIPDFTIDPKLLQKIRFICAGQSIDAMSNYRDGLRKKHQYLTSFIGYLSTCYNKEQKKIHELDVNLKPPFNTILSKQDLNNIFEDKRTLFAGDLLLWREFKEYESAKDFQIILGNKIKKNITNLYRNFSMCKFIMNPGNYDYLLCELRDWQNMLEWQSVSFVHSVGINPQTKKLLLIKTQDLNEQTEWQSYVTRNYPSCPICIFGRSPTKLTYIQIQALKKEEVKFLH